MKSLLFFLLLSVFTIHLAVAQKAKIEYIAHSAFVIESSQGTRVLIDPYHSYNWLGYTFPDTKADFVLITHPHYDHDASQYFSENTPTFREEGKFQYKDIKFEGLASKHGGAEQMAKRGLQVYNTIWIIEVEGVRIAHLGDNQTLTDDELERIGKVDFIIGQTNDEDLSKQKGRAVYIPNHYRLPEVSDYISWMEPVDKWLEGKSGISRLDSNELSFSDIPRVSSADILVFKPSQKVKAWSKDYLQVSEVSRKAGQLIQADSIAGNLDKAISYADEIIDLAPYSLEGHTLKVTILYRQKNFDEAILVLEKALAQVVDADWGRKITARRLLAQTYASMGKTALAKIQYQWVARQNRMANSFDIKQAKDYLEAHKDN